MGILDGVFAGSHGLANLLIDTLGGEATVETILEETYDEETDKTIQNVSRQVVPVVIQALAQSAANSTSPSTEIPLLVGETVKYIATLSAANLSHPPQPVKTTLRHGRDRYQVTDVEPGFVGNIKVSYKLTLRKL